MSNGIRSADSQSGFATLLSRLVLKYLPLATIFSAPFESSTLVYIINIIYNFHPKIINGVSNGIRTHDLQSHNLTLYQLRYTHHKYRTTSANRIFCIYCSVTVALAGRPGRIFSDFNAPRFI